MCITDLWKLEKKQFWVTEENQKRGVLFFFCPLLSVFVFNVLSYLSPLTLNFSRYLRSFDWFWTAMGRDKSLWKDDMKAQTKIRRCPSYFVINNWKHKRAKDWTDCSFSSVLNSCYYSWACRQSFFCLRLHSDEAYGSIQWKLTHKPCLHDKTADNCNNSH